MSAFFLLESLKSKLTEGFIMYPMLTNDNNNVLRVPNIYIGLTPPKTDKSDEDLAPYILIRSLTGEIKQGQGNEKIYEVRIGIICLVYSHEGYENIETGYNDILNMCEIVMKILNNNLYYDNNKWRFQEPVKWTSGLEKEQGIYEQGIQPHPLYTAVFEVTFYTEAPDRKIFDKGV